MDDDFQYAILLSLQDISYNGNAKREDKNDSASKETIPTYSGESDRMSKDERLAYERAIRMSAAESTPKRKEADKQSVRMSDDEQFALERAILVSTIEKEHTVKKKELAKRPYVQTITLYEFVLDTIYDVMCRKCNWCKNEYKTKSEKDPNKKQPPLFCIHLTAEELKIFWPWVRVCRAWKEIVVSWIKKKFTLLFQRPRVPFFWSGEDGKRHPTTVITTKFCVTRVTPGNLSTYHLAIKEEICPSCKVIEYRKTHDNTEIVFQTDPNTFDNTYYTIERHTREGCWCESVMYHVFLEKARKKYGFALYQPMPEIFDNYDGAHDTLDRYIAHHDPIKKYIPGVSETRPKNLWYAEHEESRRNVPRELTAASSMMTLGSRDAMITYAEPQRRRHNEDEKSISTVIVTPGLCEESHKTLDKQD